jgi:hypothetical protein
MDGRGLKGLIVEIPPPQCPSFPFIPLVPKQGLRGKGGSGGREAKATADGAIWGWRTGGGKDRTRRCSELAYGELKEAAGEDGTGNGRGGARRA